MPESYVGKTVRDYEVLERIDGGGMGHIYRARHRRVGIERAIKFVSPDLLEKAATRQRFEHEASALAKLQHPNVVAFLDFGVLDDGTQYLVMEYLQGRSLEALLTSHSTFDIAALSTVFADVCRGLEEIHRVGIVHRDLSPDNIFLARTSVGEIAKIIDFGIALPCDGRTLARLTQAGHFIGKIAYASPEQLGSIEEAEELGPASDLYSLGAVLYQALTGRLPFDATSSSALLRQKLLEPAPSLRTVAPNRDIPRRLDQLVIQLLDRDPRLRPDSAASVRRILEEISGRTPIPTVEYELGNSWHQTRPEPETRQVGEYTVEGLIGEGGMGAVYRARHNLLGVVRAVKVIKRQWMEPSAARERFLREARILAQLEHPNLVKVHDCGALPTGSYFLVQDFLDGETLRQRLDRDERLPLKEALPLIAAAARGLAAAHRKGVIHRDVSPDNLMLLRSNPASEQVASAVKVIDFGLAKTSRGLEEATLTAAGVFLGKLAYCSPEQAGSLEEGERIDSRADIYSLGVVLFQALTGSLPFESPTPVGFLAKHLTFPAPAPSSLGVDLPRELDELVLQMLHKDREQRPQSMSEISDRLSRIVASETAELAQRDEPGSDRLSSSEVAAKRPQPSRHYVAPTLVLVALFLFNLAETSLETLLGPEPSDRAYSIAAAFHSLEGWMSFDAHDAMPKVAVYGYSIAYFFFPVSAVLLAIALARRQDPRPFRLLTAAVVIDYAMSLPFFIFFPVPERWIYPDSGAILLSDVWSSKLIEFVRPISGIDNCFPSFHVSLATIAVLVAFLTSVPFRWTLVPITAAIMLSTYALGIHWIPDILAGVAVGGASTALAMKWIAKNSHLQQSPARPQVASQG